MTLSSTNEREKFKLFTLCNGQNERVRESFPPIMKIDLKKLKTHQDVKGVETDALDKFAVCGFILRQLPQHFIKTLSVRIN